MQILVIAGGDGSRMKPLVTHKSLFPFFGKTLLEHLLTKLSIFSGAKLFIVSHPTALAQIEEVGSKYDAKVIMQKLTLGMADAVISAKEVLDPNDSVLVVDAVTVQEPGAYSTFLDSIKKNSTSILLGGRKVPNYKHGGYFVFDAKGAVSKIIEKPGPQNMPSNFLKLVLDYFPNTRELLRFMNAAKSSQDDVYEVALSQMISVKGAKMVELAGFHTSLKHAPRVLDVIEVFLDHYLVPGIDKTAQIAATAVIEGNVMISSGVRVFDHATIKGPAYIGENTVIGNGSLVRSSCIEADCEIGYNTEVARSYIGPNTKCHTSYVGDSILEGDINLAAGTITANLRFDNRNIIVNLPSGRFDSGRRKFGSILAKGVKTGIHASLMPGTIAEPDSIIGSEVQYGNDKK